jgi:saccharopine dehydrogenase-like NADP-dependent oxidoreductase
VNKRILILGAGFVAEPVVEYLSREPENHLTLVSHIIQEADRFASKYPQVTPMAADVTDLQQMSDLVRTHDLVISLVPYSFHVSIAKLCIEHKVPMVTASYVSSDMQALDASARENGVLILNEIGLDPGIDHLSAMKVIDEAHDKGAKIVSFASWCGGLPAPECNNNPLGYKFAWAPRAVLLALLNEARYLKDGKEQVVHANELLRSVKPVKVSDELMLEGYPNRNSVPYREAYGIPEVRNLIRGTLRYPGFSEIFEAAERLGLLSVERSTEPGLTWKDWYQRQQQSLAEPISETASAALRWLGLESDLPLPESGSMLDAFCELLKSKLNYHVGEYDMTALQHRFEIEYDGRSEFLSSTLIVKGEPGGFSAMAKTVGYPVAIAAQLILDGEIDDKGVKIPVERHLYEPLLEVLEKENIVCVEKNESTLDELFFTR